MAIHNSGACITGERQTPGIKAQSAGNGGDILKDLKIIGTSILLFAASVLTGAVVAQKQGTSAFSLHPDGSPDGSKVLFQSRPGESIDMFQVNQDEAEFEHLSSGSTARGDHFFPRAALSGDLLARKFCDLHPVSAELPLSKQ